MAQKGIHLFPFRMGLFLILCVACLVPGVSAFRRGAPSSTCLTRYPKHGTGTQTVNNPYFITFNTSDYTPGEVIQVTIGSTDNRDLVGFQMGGFRSDNPEELVGQFTSIPEETAKYITCPGGYKNMVTHKINTPVSSVVVEWTAPSYNAGNILFLATVVENYRTFWIDVEATLSTNDTADIQQPIYQNVVAQEIVMSTNFSGCGEFKSCFLYPRDCDAGSCKAAVSFQYRTDTDDFLVEMYADTSSDPDYVGVAFSSDEKMGGDETFICAANTQQMSIQYGYNPSRYNQRLITEYISDAQVKRADGRIQCRFVMQSNSTVSVVDSQATESSSDTIYTRVNFDKSKPWHVQLAWGPLYSDSNVIATHKEMPVSSSSKIYIKEIDVHRGDIFHKLVKVHAVVMIVAWTFLSGIVTVIARHYRDLMHKTQLFGAKVWFQVHRALAILMTILTAIGLGTIFGHYGAGIREASKPHAYVGLAVTAALGAQVLAGILRPGHDSSFRVIFNWGHRFLGHASHILAAFTMILAFDIDYMSDDMRDNGFITLGVWIGVQLLWHIFFEIFSRLNDRSSENLSKDGFSDNNDKKSSWIPGILLIIYILFLAACCAAVIYAFLSY